MRYQVPFSLRNQEGVIMVEYKENKAAVSQGFLRYSTFLTTEMFVLVIRRCTHTLKTVR